MNPEHKSSFCYAEGQPKQSAYDRYMEQSFQTNSEVEQAAMNIYKEDGKIQAIMFWRNRTACGLKEAKEKIEALYEGKKANPLEMTYNGDTYERADKIFDLQNLVTDCACPEGLIGVIKFFGRAIYGGVSNNGIDKYSFSDWYNREGSRHTGWLKANGYIKVRRNPKQVVEECLAKVHEEAGWWAQGSRDPELAMQTINHFIEDMQEELRRK
jgi:hypothetical protein